MSKLIFSGLTILFLTGLLLLQTSCSFGGGGNVRSSYGVGYGYNDYYGRSWGGNYPGYIGGGGGNISPPSGGGGAPEPVQLPSMGIPDMGGDVGTMDM